jgi:methionyl-tRNA formyltransferase
VSGAPASNSTGDTLRLGFAGTPEFAAKVLAGLLQAGRRPVVVYTQPDRRAGRGRRLQQAPVKALALDHKLALCQPESLRRADVAAALADLTLDVLVVAAYGLILPPAVLAAPRLGCINVHASLLPRWRGAAPIERAIMAGDEMTGISIMKMDRGLDTGPVYLRRRCAVGAGMDGPTLEDALARLGCEALLECLDALPDLQPAPQPDLGISYAHKLTRADAVIDWSRPALAIERQVRALCARMPAVTGAGGVRMAILEALAMEAAVAGLPGAMPGGIVAARAAGIEVACGEGILNISRLKLSVGKGRVLRAADAINGYPALFTVGASFGEPAP